MRIVFIGGVQFSELALHRLMKLNAQVVGVCTAKLGQPDSDRIDLAAVCDDYGLNVRHCDDINDQATVDWITALAPDVIFCFSWSRLIGHHFSNCHALALLVSPVSASAKQGAASDYLGACTRTDRSIDVLCHG